MRGIPIIVLGFCFSGALDAATTTFLNEADFLAAVTPTNIENFEDESVTPQVTSLSTDLLSVTTTPLNGGTSYLLIAEFGNPTSLHETDGTKYLNSGSLTNDPWRHDFTLVAPATALAFDLTDAFEREVPGGGQSMVKLTLGNGEEFVLGTCPPCAPTGSEFFFGVTSPDAPFSEFSITNTAFSDGIGYDRIQLVIVPQGEPLACIGFDAPMNTVVKVKKNRVLPLKVQLMDANGQYVDDLGLASKPALQVLFDSAISPMAEDVTDQSLPSGVGTDGNQFEFLDGKWQYNLKAKNFSAPGTYTVSLVSGDSGEYRIEPNCSTQFVID